MSNDINELQAIHQQNAQLHRCAVGPEDYRDFESKLALIKRLSAIQNSTFTIYDMDKNHYLLKSAEFKKMLGYTDPEDLKNDDMGLFHKLIHPDDLPFVLDTENKAFSFFRSLPVPEKKDYKLVYDFRVKNLAGVYMRFIHQFVVLEQDRNGTSWLVLIVTDLIAERAIESKPQRRMINQRTGKLHLFNDDDHEKNNTLLTRRETEVLRMIAQGLDSKSIAEKLFISTHTVNNHRQNILTKTRTENTTQALLYAKRIGII